MRGDPVILHFLAQTRNGPIKTTVDTSKFPGSNLPEKTILHRRFAVACQPALRKLGELRATGDPRVTTCPACLASKLLQEALPLWQPKEPTGAQQCPSSVSPPAGSQLVTQPVTR